MVILLVFDLMVKASAAWKCRAVNAIQYMDEPKHSGIAFCHARPSGIFYGQIAG
jgi:hypothetical protein